MHTCVRQLTNCASVLELRSHHVCLTIDIYINLENAQMQLGILPAVGDPGLGIDVASKDTRLLRHHLYSCLLQAEHFLS